MEDLTSPDLPALWCYGVVTLAGLVVGRRNVAKSLEGMDGRWRFGSTWWLFAAYALVPVLLFWLLSWTEVIHDTSLVAAVIVGLGYRQVATTGLAGITVRGQWQVWQPFEAWANGIAQKIIDRNAADRAAAFDRLEDHISTNDSALEKLWHIAWELAVDVGGTAGATLKGDLERIENELKSVGPPVADGPAGSAAGVEASVKRLTARRLLREVRTRASHFEQTIIDRGVAGREELDEAFGRASSKAMVALVVVVALALGAIVWATEPWGNSTFQREFYVWRMGIESATASDQDRTHAFFTRAFDLGRYELADRVIGQLERRTATTVYADRALPLIIETRARLPALDTLIIPALIDALRARQADVRSRVQNTLNEIRELDYADRPLEDATRTWSPTDRDRPTRIESHVRAWSEWWRDGNHAVRDTSPERPEPTGG